PAAAGGRGSGGSRRRAPPRSAGRALPCLEARAWPFGAHLDRAAASSPPPSMNQIRGAWMRLSRHHSVLLQALVYLDDRSGAESVTEERPRVTSAGPHRSVW